MSNLKPGLFAAIIMGLVMIPVVTLAGPPPTGGVIIGDWNGDGKSDAMAQKAADPNSGLLRSLIFDGSSLMDSGFPTVLGAGLVVQGAGNFTGAASGKDSVFVRKVSGANSGLIRILVLDAAGTGLASSAFPALISTEFSLLGNGDFDNDGIDDIGLVKTSGNNVGLVRILFMNSDLTVRESAFPTMIPTSFTPVGVGDADDDGNADIIAVNNSTNLVRVFLFAPDGKSVESSQFPGSKPAAFDAIGVADTNGDNRVDLQNRNIGTGLIRAQLMGAGASSFEGSAFTSLGTTFGVGGNGDYNALTGADLLARKAANPNAGLIRILLLNIDGTVSSSGFPLLLNPSFDLAPLDLPAS